MAVIANAPQDRNVHPDFARRVAQACEANGPCLRQTTDASTGFRSNSPIDLAWRSPRRPFGNGSPVKPSRDRRRSVSLPRSCRWTKPGFLSGRYLTPKAGSPSKTRQPRARSTWSPGWFKWTAVRSPFRSLTTSGPRRRPAHLCDHPGCAVPASYRHRRASRRRRLALQRAGGRARSGCPGLMRLEPFGFRIVELDSEGLGSVGARKGGFIEVELDSDLRSGAHSWAEVTTFSKRL